MGNVWFDANRRKIEAIKRKLVEYNFAGSYGGSLNLLEINSIMQGMIIEIEKLDRENNELKKKLESIQKLVEPKTNG